MVQQNRVLKYLKKNVSFERTVEIMNTNLYTGINSPSITSKKNKERKKNQ